ncbi:hypothetical protein I7I48_01638 [Histoplasma ohiense]|nr:hypothetical protein I7I48_01638 [Histoplasma ohiense (nom. inval.)]
MHYTNAYLSCSGWEITDWHRVTKEQALLYNDEYQLIRPAIHGYNQPIRGHHMVTPPSHTKIQSLQAAN